MQSLIDVRHWGGFLSRRSPGLGAIAFLAEGAAAIRKHAAGVEVPQIPTGFAARRLQPEEVMRLDRSHWQPSPRLSWDGSLDYFARRFSPSGFRSCEMFGVFDASTARVEGLVAIEGGSSLNILECAANPQALSSVQAVELAASCFPESDSVRIALLPRSQLAADFAHSGFVRLNERFSSPVIRNTFWSACWLNTHPLATAIADVTRWDLWYGWSHH